MNKTFSIPQELPRWYPEFEQRIADILVADTAEKVESAKSLFAKFITEQVSRVDAEVKHEIAEEETIVIWGEPLRKKKSKTLDDYSDCKLPKLPEDCDATESDIY